MSNTQNAILQVQEIIKAAHRGSFPVKSIDITWEVVTNEEGDVIEILPSISIKYQINE